MHVPPRFFTRCGCSWNEASRRFGWAGENNGLFEHPAGQARCYNGPAMKELATENIAIGVLASIGVLVLIVVFIYVVRQIITRKD